MIHLKSDAEIDQMKPAGGLAAKLLELVEAHIRPGVTTLELNELCHEFTISKGAISAPLNYKGFPKSICTSINDVVCHGIPSAKVRLKDGDIINVDVTPILNGFHGDTSKTFFVGNVSKEKRKLVEAAQRCLEIGIEQVKPGARVGDIGAAIQKYAEGHGYSVVRDFVGHGIGRTFHEDPSIPHYGKPGTGKAFEPGMTFTIEPMINEGHWKTKVKKDKWTAVTLDGGYSAQFEHTLAIRSSGVVEVLTSIENYGG